MVLVLLILAILAVPALPRVYAAFPPSGVVDYLPITLTNNQAGSFTTSTSVLLNIPWNNYAGYLDSDVDNVGIFDSSGNLLLAWCESNCINTAASSNVWFLPDSSSTIAGGVVRRRSTSDSTRSVLIIMWLITHRPAALSGPRLLFGAKLPSEVVLTATSTARQSIREFLTITIISRVILSSVVGPQ